MDRQRSGGYQGLLEEAFGMGRADGRANPAGEHLVLGTCAGLDADEFAALLWAPRPGAPPAGLVLNAPLWYATGVHSAAAPPPVPRPRGSVRQARETRRN